MKNSIGSRFVRIGAILGASILAFGIGSSASAWTFATQSSPQRAIYNGVSFADGAGSLVRSGWNDIITTTQLRDPVANSGAAYQESSATSSASWGQTQSDRRTGSSWASVSTPDYYSTAGWVGATATSKVCEDVALRPDICSTSKAGRL